MYQFKIRLAVTGVIGAVPAFAQKAPGRLASNLRFNILIIFYMQLNNKNSTNDNDNGDNGFQIKVQHPHNHLHM